MSLPTSLSLSVTASEKVIVKQKGLQCVCVCVCSTVFKLSQPSLCLALVKVPQQRAECAHGGALSPPPPLPRWVDEIFVEVTFVSRQSSEPAERFWFLLRGDLLGDALLIWFSVSVGIQLRSTSLWLEVPVSTFGAGRLLFLDSSSW